ncbi:MAG: dienelactone hydrolase family protein [Mycobacteriaceae bacterium]|nr:dienelactone hydrolase family protein [Mycobacteriaceae bacterium]
MPDISYACPAGPLPGYQAVPVSHGPWPGVVVVHDALGMTADVRRITDRFASNGYLALAPALYRRGHKLHCVVSTFTSLRRGLGVAVDDLAAAREHLAADERCTGRVGIVGFCMGGGFCLLLATHGVFDAAAPNYGMMPADTDALRRACPVVASYGAMDRMLAPNTAATLKALLADGGVPHDVKEYPEVGHSFMNDFPTPSAVKIVERIAGLAYSEPEAEDAWRRILAFFDEHLG